MYWVMQVVKVVGLLLVVYVEDELLFFGGVMMEGDWFCYLGLFGVLEVVEFV